MTSTIPSVASPPTPVVPSEPDRVCVVGAGSSGLAVCRALKEAGIPYDCLEKHDQIGGNWCYDNPNSSVCQSTHLISSKRLTEYPDFPMPDDYPAYPSHRLVFDYLRRFAEHHKLGESIELGIGVRHAHRDPAGGWVVETTTGETRRYAALVIANGHNWDPRTPDVPGSFGGLQLHSSEYKTPDILRGKRVLVVGAGNSGCDIAVESSSAAAVTRISMRRGYHFLPKFFRGQPIDRVGERLLRWRVPLSVRRRLASWVAYLVLGGTRSLGMPQPDHKLFETHPIINSQLIYHLRHGGVAVRPDLAEFCGDRVRFADGSTEHFDVIVYATGFKITVPFVDRCELNWRDGKPDLYLNIFHPEADDLFFAGLIQPDSGQWGLVDRQARLIAAYLHGLRHDRRSALGFKDRKRRGSAPLNAGIQYVDSPRHLLEVEHHSYAKTLDRMIAQLA